MVQFCEAISRRFSLHTDFTYPANHASATLTLAYHIPRTFAHASARQLARGIEVDMCLLQTRRETRANIGFLEVAAQRVLDELVSVLEQIGAELPTRAREIMQGVQVELAGKLSDNTVSLMWLAIHQGAELRPCVWFRLTDNSSGRLKIH